MWWKDGGIIFLSVIVGVPLLCLVIIISYLAHRRNLKSILQNEGVNAHDETPVSIAYAIREVFLMPDQFFKRITGNRINLWRPFLLITIGGVFFFLSAYFSLGIIIWVIIFPLILLHLYICWILITGLVYGITLPLKGEGPFITTLQNSGYGIGLGLIIIDLLYIIPLTFFYQPFTLGPPLPQAAKTTMTIFTVILLIIALWSAAIVSIGLKHARNIPLSRAAIAVYSVLIVYLVWTYKQYIFAILGLR
jgi:hypothetical protein